MSTKKVRFIKEHYSIGKGSVLEVPTAQVGEYLEDKIVEEVPANTNLVYEKPEILEPEKKNPKGKKKNVHAPTAKK